MKLIEVDRLSKELEFAIDLALRAGGILLDNYDDPAVDTKKDGSIIKAGDRKSSAFITSELKKAFPGHGILDEETREDGSRFVTRHCWVIDPLDSTRDYHDRQPDFGVIIGLMDTYVPVLGVTYKPLKNELAYAVKGNGAFLYRNGAHFQQLRVSTSDEIRALVSRSRKSEELDCILAKLKPEKVEHMNGSLKTIEIAKGEVYTLFVCPTSSKMSLWDFCGPQIILEEAGGKLTKLSGEAFDYLARDTANYEGAIASNGVIHEKVLAALREE